MNPIPPSRPNQFAAVPTEGVSSPQQGLLNSIEAWRQQPGSENESRQIVAAIFIEVITNNHLELNLADMNISSLPCFPNSLQHINLSNMGHLITLPSLPNRLVSLSLDNVPQLTSLPEIPQTTTSLALTDCHAIALLPVLPPRMQHLTLTRCFLLLEIPFLPLDLIGLTIANMDLAPPFLPHSLQYLNLSHNRGFAMIQRFPPSLQDINLMGCANLESSPPLPRRIVTFNITGCTNLRACQGEIPEILVGQVDVTGCDHLSPALIAMFMGI